MAYERKNAINKKKQEEKPSGCGQLDAGTSKGAPLRGSPHRLRRRLPPPVFGDPAEGRIERTAEACSGRIRGLAQQGRCPRWTPPRSPRGRGAGDAGLRPFLLHPYRERLGVPRASRPSRYAVAYGQP